MGKNLIRELSEAHLNFDRPVPPSCLGTSTASPGTKDGFMLLFISIS